MIETPLTDNFEDVQLTPNFWLSEFLFSDFYAEGPQERVLEAFYIEELVYTRNVKRLARNLQLLRDYLGCPISINISFRPKWWELKQGRSGNSQHTKAWAADIVSSEHSPEQVADAIEELIDKGIMDQGGLGRYSSFTHYDLFAPDADGRRWGSN